MKNAFSTILFGIILAGMTASITLAQTADLTLGLRRDFGYGGFNNDIQGLFTMTVKGPADLVKVEFLIDDEIIKVVENPPFGVQFSTDNYPLGIHQLHATGYTAQGQEYTSNVITVSFVPAQSSMKVILPVIGLILAAVLLSALVPLVSSRRKHINIPLGTERNYGIRGGGICPKCKRPFVMPLFSMHLGFSNFAVCPHCGKTGFVSRQPIEKLRQAERDELDMTQPSQPVVEETEEEKLQRQLDESKYKD